MAKFTDHTGHDWEVTIVFAHLKRLREDFGIQTKATPKEFFGQVSEVIGDPERLYELLLLLCGKQLAEAKIDPEQFAHVLAGDTLRAAAVAVTEAIFDFCQGPNAAKEMAEAIRAAMNETDQTIARAMQKATPLLISKLRAGGSLESSESTPATEVSAN